MLEHLWYDPGGFGHRYAGTIRAGGYEEREARREPPRSNRAPRGVTPLCLGVGIPESFC